MNNVELLTVGTDFELFLQDKRTNEVISAENIVKGEKYNPFQYDPNNPDFTTSLDNILWEGTVPAANSARQFIRHLNKAMAYIRSSIPKHLDLLIVPAAVLDDKWLQTENAKTMGDSLPS
jgi:hypothetical protein